MSNGAQIGGAIGAVIGAYWGGPQGAQLGYMIGSTIGGYIDPAQVFGPRMQDASAQTAQDGVPRAYGYGTFPTTGNLIWCSSLTEKKNVESSKGAPTETVTYQYLRSYAIAVCRGPEDGNGIAGFRIVKRNGKVVYDTRTDDELTALGYSSNEIAETRAAQMKFIRKAAFYYGTAEQEPDPTIQAVKTKIDPVNGATDVPGYSYTAYMVVRDDDVTELRGAVPQYQFVVSVCGDRQTDEGPAVDGMRWFFDGPPIKPSPDGIDWTSMPVRSSPLMEAPMYVLHGGKMVVADYGSGATKYSDPGDLNTWPSGPGTTSPRGVASYPNSITGRLFWPLGGASGFPGHPALAWIDDIVSGSWTTQPQLTHPFADNTPVCTVVLGEQDNIVRGGTRVFHRSSNRGIAWEPAGIISAASFSMWTGDYTSGIYAVAGYDSVLGSAGIYSSDDFATSWVAASLPSSAIATTVQQLMYVAGNIWLAFTSAGLWQSFDNCKTFEEIDLGEPVEFSLSLGLRCADVNRVSGRVVMYGETASGVKMWVGGGSSIVFTEVPYSDGPPLTIKCINPQSFDGLLIPDAPSYYVDPITGEIVGSGATTITQCAPTLGEIVEAQCALRGVTTVDVSELDDEVLGFRIANTSSPQKNIQALQPGYMFDGSEFDGKLWFPKRGGDDSFHIAFDDLVMRDGDAIQWERKQEAELLRKVTVGYFDPFTTYTPTSQQWERRAGTVKAQGEGTIQLPVVGDGNWAAQAADKNGKVAWAEGDECTLHVSLDWAELVTAAVGTIEDENGTIHRIRIEQIQDDALVRKINARRTNSQVYLSTATGVGKPLPTFPGSDLRGPTLSALLNMPALLDTQDRPGLYWAATGVFTTWAGAALQVLRAGVWTNLATTSSGSVVGSLAADLPNHAGDIDTVNTLSIRIKGSLQNITFEQLLSEQNAVAIAYPDGTVEVVQFQNAEIDTDGVWQCTTLLRRRLNTTGGTHSAGAAVVLLDTSVQFVDLRPDDLGRTLTFRVVGLGTDPDTAVTFDYTLTRIWSSTEWPVAMFEVERDGDDFSLSWIPRNRLGTDVDPVRSSNWDGFLVRWQHSDQFFEEVLTTTSTTYNLPGASDVTFSVAQLNRLTGAGPASTVTIP